MATANPPVRLKAGVRLPGLRVSVALLVTRTTIVVHIRLRLRWPAIVVHLALRCLRK